MSSYSSRPASRHRDCKCVRVCVCVCVCVCMCAYVRVSLASSQFSVYPYGDRMHTVHAHAHINITQTHPPRLSKMLPSPYIHTASTPGATRRSKRTNTHAHTHVFTQKLQRACIQTDTDRHRHRHTHIQITCMNIQPDKPPVMTAGWNAALLVALESAAPSHARRRLTQWFSAQTSPGS